MTSQEMVNIVANALDDKKAEDIVILDMEGISLVAEKFVICHGNSDKQVQAIAQNLKDEMSKHGIETKRTEGTDEARWVLVDLGDIIVHIFHKDERGYYNLEKLWGDAPQYAINEM
jgi:ribosome-associated protein